MKKHTWLVLVLIIAMLVPMTVIRAQDEQVVTIT
jgi:hypothetical protein